MAAAHDTQTSCFIRNPAENGEGWCELPRFTPLLLGDKQLEKSNSLGTPETPSKLWSYKSMPHDDLAVRKTCSIFHMEVGVALVISGLLSFARGLEYGNGSLILGSSAVWGSVMAFCLKFDLENCEHVTDSFPPNDVAFMFHFA